MKLIVYTNFYNKLISEAKIKGFTHKVQALCVEKNEWYTLYYRDEETAQKEYDRMVKLGPSVYKNIRTPTAI